MKRSILWALLTVALLFGCAPTYKRLPTLDRVPELHALSSRSEASRIRLWELPVGEVDGEPYRIVAEETGVERGDLLVVLVHGLVSDRTTWQFVAGHLAPTHRLWMPDQLGCGDSDRPDPDEVGEATYSSSGSARNILEALRQRNDEAGWPDRIVFAGHSLGGAVVLRILGSNDLRRDYPKIYERMERAVLIAPLEFAVHRADQTLAEMSQIGAFKLSLGRGLGVFQETVAKELLHSAENPDYVFKFDADRLLDAFDGKPARRATQAIIRQAVPFDEETERPDWDEIERLVADYANVRFPVLVLWGNRDETLPLSMGYKLLAELPDARLRILRGGKHSLQADRPEMIADWLREFVDNPVGDWPRLEWVD